MTHRSARIAVLGAVFAFELGASLVLPPARGAEPTNDEPASYSDAMRVRTTFGLRSDSEYVRESLQNPIAFSEDPLGVPMTSAEAAEIWRRLEVQHRIDQLSVWAASNLDGFAGMYIDQLNAGQPVFLVRTGSDVSGLFERSPSGIEIDIREVEYSHKELLELQGRLSNERDALVADGIPLTETAIDTAGNVVVVGLDEETATSSDRVAVTERFGGAVRVEPTTPGSDDACFASDCMPTRSGIGMRSTVKQNACTIGWPVRSTSTRGSRPPALA